MMAAMRKYSVLQRCLFDPGEPVPRQKSTVVIRKRIDKSSVFRQHRYLFSELIASDGEVVQFQTSRKIVKDRTGLKDPAWFMDAGFVEDNFPEKHAELQYLIYQIRAPMVRATWNDHHERKQNNYPVMPIFMKPVDTNL